MSEPSFKLTGSKPIVDTDLEAQTVFISYSHDSEVHKERVLELANRLREDGIDANLDQYEESPPEGWPRWMLNQVENSDYTLVVCSETYDRRFRGKEEVGRGKGVTWEGAVIINELYQAQARNLKFIPVTFTDNDLEYIPSPLESATVYNFGQSDGYEGLYRRLTNQPLTKKPQLGKRQTLPARTRKQQFQDRAEPGEAPAKQIPQADQPNFFALDDQWVGRTTLIHNLSSLIQSNCRLLMLLGITGIGKTALGERLSVEVIDWLGNDWFYYHQENFDNDQQSSDFISVAARWLEKWGELVTPEDRKDPERLMNRTISYLRKNRYLVQMDSLENILQGDEEEGWNDFKDAWWLKFFTSYLKVDSCQSCFILTSQDMPGQLEEVGTRSQNFWHSQPLSGLDKPEQLKLFKKIELDISDGSESKDRLEQIGQAYEGHPLALRVIGGEIKNTPFNGNVVAYWNRYGNEVQEVLDAIEEAKAGSAEGAEDKWKLHRFTKNLRRNVQSRLKKTFERLKSDAKWSYILLCEASVYRCEVPEGFWLSHLEDWDRDEDEQSMALDALRERYLVEQIITDNQIMLKQHNLVRSLSLQCLKKLDDDFE